MVEILVFATILISGLLALTSTVVTVDRLRRSNDELRLASNALDMITTEIRRTAIRARSSENGWAQGIVDVYGNGGTQGSDLPVTGLEPRVGAPGTLHIELVTDETLTDQELELQLGLPIDQNADGLIASTDTTGDAIMLPVIVSVEWAGVAGPGQLRHGFFVASY